MVVGCDVFAFRALTGPGVKEWCKRVVYSPSGPVPPDSQVSGACGLLCGVAGAAYLRRAEDIRG